MMVTRIIDIDGMIRQASNRISLQQLVRRAGRKDIELMSRSALEQLINRAVRRIVRKHRAQGAWAPGISESQLEAESRREFDALLREEEPLACLEEEPAPPTFPFDKMELEPGRGLDLGTVNARAAARRTGGGDTIVNLQNNAFLDVRRDAPTQQVLKKFGLEGVVRGDRSYVVGDAAVELASLFDQEPRRPMKDGMISSQEPESLGLITHLVERLLGRARREGEICAFSMPSDAVDSGFSSLYHRGMVESLLRTLGYSPKAVPESHAIVLSELREQEYTGLGLSCGGGRFDACVAYKGVAALSFSTLRGGDWVDRQAAAALGLPASVVRAVKEGGMDLTRPKDRVEAAVALFTRNLLQYTLGAMTQRLAQSEHLPTFKGRIDIICAGGTSMTAGFVDLFAEEFLKVEFPLPILDVRKAARPLTAVAEGCLHAASEETLALSVPFPRVSTSALGRTPMSAVPPSEDDVPCQSRSA